MNIAVIGMGEMGLIFSQNIRNAEVYTYLSKKRSLKTKKKVKSSNVKITSTFSELIEKSDMIFSILPCEKALNVAARVSREKIIEKKFFIECNPLSSKKIKKIKSYFKSTKFSVIDAAIIGPPPIKSVTTLYISGTDTKMIENLNISNIKIKNLGKNFGDASKLKLLFSGINKGLNALIYQILDASLTLKLNNELKREINNRIPFLSKRLQNQKPKVMKNAGRYISEMKEISEELKINGFSGGFHKDASATFKYISENVQKSKDKKL